MNEHELYMKHPEAWVFYLATKYCKGDKFKEAVRGLQSALTEEELEAARDIWRKEQGK